MYSCSRNKNITVIKPGNCRLNCYPALFNCYWYDLSLKCASVWREIKFFKQYLKARQDWCTFLANQPAFWHSQVHFSIPNHKSWISHQDAGGDVAQPISFLRSLMCECNITIITKMDHSVPVPFALSFTDTFAHTAILNAVLSLPLTHPRDKQDSRQAASASLEFVNPPSSASLFLPISINEQWISLV